MFLRSNCLMGVTSAAVPVKKASSAVYISSRVRFFSITSMPRSFAMVITESRVIPSSALESDGVNNLPFFTINIFSPEPSHT